MRSLTNEVLGPYLERIRIEGRDIQLPADLAFDLALVLHELATNSLKYGSLAGSDGTIHLAWRIEKTKDAMSFAMDWSYGKPVASQARGTGFGSILKRAIVEQKWKGAISVASEGPYRFSCRIPLPPADASRNAGPPAESATVTDFDPIDPARD